MKTYNEIKLAQELIRFPTIKTEDRGIMKFLTKNSQPLVLNVKLLNQKELAENQH